MKKNKLVFVDIETSPNLGYTWAKFEQNVIEFKKEWELLSFAYKIQGQSRVTCVSRNQFKDSTDKTITIKLWELLDSSEILVAHNGNSFDFKKSSAKFIEHGLTPPSPYKTIDTLRIARAKFKLNSNKLNDLGKLFGVGQKEDTGGFQLWLGCMAGLRSAWRVMIRYNKRDVLLLERVYEKMKPWINNHPSIADRPENCPKCNGEHLQARGVVTTKTQTYRRFVCRTCGGWLRLVKADKDAKKPKYTNA